MSRSDNGFKRGGTDWWSRRPNAGLSAGTTKAGTMKWWKRNTHKKERKMCVACGTEQTKGHHCNAY